MNKFLLITLLTCLASSVCASTGNDDTIYLVLRRTPFSALPQSVLEKRLGNPLTGTMTTALETMRVSNDGKWIILDCAGYHDEEGILQRPDLEGVLTVWNIDFTAYTHAEILIVIQGANWVNDDPEGI